MPQFSARQEILSVRKYYVDREIDEYGESSLKENPYPSM